MKFIELMKRGELCLVRDPNLAGFDKAYVMVGKIHVAPCIYDLITTADAWRLTKIAQALEVVPEPARGRRPAWVPKKEE